MRWALAYMTVLIIAIVQILIVHEKVDLKTKMTVLAFYSLTLFVITLLVFHVSTPVPFLISSFKPVVEGIYSALG